MWVGRRENVRIVASLAVGVVVVAWAMAAAAAGRE